MPTEVVALLQPLPSGTFQPLCLCTAILLSSPCLSSSRDRLSRGQEILALLLGTKCFGWEQSQFPLPLH